jgi:hypothetical protein
VIDGGALESLELKSRPAEEKKPVPRLDQPTVVLLAVEPLHLLAVAARNRSGADRRRPRRPGNHQEAGGSNHRAARARILTHVLPHPNQTPTESSLGPE